MSDGSSLPSQQRSLLAALLVLLSAYVAVNCLVTAWFSKAILDGESASLLSVAITFAETGRLSYPLYDYVHRLFGFTNTAVHPPLHYALEGLVLSAAGYGPLQFTATNVGVTLIGLAVASLVCLRLYGAPAAALVWMVAAALRVLYDPATGARSDVLLGLLYLLTTLACMEVLFGPTRRRQCLAAGLAGFLAAGSLAAHYYGLMTLGLALVVAVALIARRGLKAWPEGLAALGGGVLGLGLWYFAYGAEFLKIGPFMRMISAVTDIRIDTPFRVFWEGVLDMAGGWIFLAGVASFAAHLAFRAGRAAAGSPARDAHLVRDAFLLFAAAWPVAYLWLYTDNHNYRYWIDLIFVGLVVSAAGFAWPLSAIARRFVSRSTAIRVGGAAALAIAIGCTSPVIKTYFTGNPASLRSPNAIYEEARARIKSVVPGDVVLLTGTPGYPYVHDYRVVSTMDLVMQQVIKVAPPVEFAVASAAYQETMATYPRNLPGSAVLAALAAESGSYMLVGPDCHFWSCLFFRPEVTRARFSKVASVVLLRDNLTGRPTPNLRDTARLLSVFARSDDANSGVMRTVAPAMERSENVGFIRYPQRQGLQDPSKDVWQKASAEDKLGVLRRFLEDRGWFGLSPSDADRQRIVDHMRPRIDAAFGAPEILELSAAFDYALTDPRAWTVFPVPVRG